MTNQIKLITTLKLPQPRRNQILARIDKTVFTKANLALLNKHTTGVPLPMPRGLAAGAARAGNTIEPVIQFILIEKFPYPVFGPDEQTILGWENIDVTAANWITTQFGLRWDWMYRVFGTVVPIKPPFVIENGLAGAASIVLPASQEYEYLAMFR